MSLEALIIAGLVAAAFVIPPLFVTRTRGVFEPRYRVQLGVAGALLCAGQFMLFATNSQVVQRAMGAFLGFLTLAQLIRWTHRSLISLLPMPARATTKRVFSYEWSMPIVGLIWGLETAAIVGFKPSWGLASAVISFVVMGGPYAAWLQRTYSSAVSMRRLLSERAHLDALLASVLISVAFITLGLLLSVGGYLEAYHGFSRRDVTPMVWVAAGSAVAAALLGSGWHKSRILGGLSILAALVPACLLAWLAVSRDASVGVVAVVAALLVGLAFADSALSNTFLIQGWIGRFPPRVYLFLLSPGMASVGLYGLCLVDLLDLVGGARVSLVPLAVAFSLTAVLYVVHSAVVVTRIKTWVGKPWVTEQSGTFNIAIHDAIIIFAVALLGQLMPAVLAQYVGGWTQRNQGLIFLLSSAALLVLVRWGIRNGFVHARGEDAPASGRPSGKSFQDRLNSRMARQWSFVILIAVTGWIYWIAFGN